MTAPQMVRIAWKMVPDPMVPASDGSGNMIARADVRVTVCFRRATGEEFVRQLAPADAAGLELGAYVLDATIPADAPAPAAA